MKFIRVNKVQGYREGYYDNEGDGMVEDQNQPPTMAVTISPATIKSYYNRKGGRVGTRINFTMGNGFAIAETPAEFEALLAEAGAQFIGTHFNVPVPAATSADQVN